MKVVLTVGEARTIIKRYLQKTGRLPEDKNCGPTTFHWLDLNKSTPEMLNDDLVTFQFVVNESQFAVAEDGFDKL